MIFIKKLFILLFFIIVIIGCSADNSTDFSKISNPNLINYLSNNEEIKLNINGEKIKEDFFIKDIDLENDMIKSIVKSQKECEGLLTSGKYKWIDFNTESYRVTTFISLDKNEIVCNSFRKKFSPRIVDEP